MKKLIISLLATGLIAGSCMGASAAAATDYMKQIEVQAQYGWISNIEVNTTYSQLVTEMKARGYTVYSPGNNRKVYTGADFYMQTGKLSDFVLIVNGDVNCDGNVDESDRAKINDYLAAKVAGTQENIISKGSWEFMAGDLDKDGSITISDLMEVIKIINRHAND